jgi:flagellar biosynthetic protein FliR
MDQLFIPIRPVLIFLLVLARVGGLVTFAPFWGHKAANSRIRVVLALALALVITPVVMPRIPTPPSDYGPFAVLMIGELVIGCVLGFAGRLVFSALEMAAQVLTFQMGFSLASAIDPSTQSNTASLAILAQMIGLMILLASDGHHWFLLATVKSYQTVAPGNFEISQSLVHLFLRLSADAIAVGVALAAPAIIILLVVEFALAIFGQAAPQFQILLLGFPIKIAVGLWLIGASLYFMPGAVRTTLNAIRAGLAHALAAM